MTILKSLVIALSMYSIVPMPQLDWREDNMRWSLGFLPVVGALAAGLLYLLSMIALSFPMSPLLFAALAVVLPLVVSGGFHMDGFLDATDAIFSRRERTRKLEIMKDPCCGPFALICCGGLLLLEFGAWHQLIGTPSLLPVACLLFVFSRSLTVMAGSRLPYAPTSTLGVLFADRAAGGVRLLGLLEALGVSLLLILTGFYAAGTQGLLCAALTTLSGWLLYFWYRGMVMKSFGGVTGDLLGYLVELSQLIMLLLLACLSTVIR